MTEIQRNRLTKQVNESRALGDAFTLVRSNTVSLQALNAVEARAAELAPISNAGGREFAPRFIGACATPYGREQIEKGIDNRTRIFSNKRREEALSPGGYKCTCVVIGSGVTAASFVSTWSLFYDQGLPLVVEARERLGGVFAVAKRPVFYLNSRNRRSRSWEVSGPGTVGPLNVIPGGFIQPADLSAEEYQDQATLALAARINLSCLSSGWVDARVTEVLQGDERRYRLAIDGGGTVETDIVVIATGVGSDRMTVRMGASGGVSTGGKVLTFTQFVERMGNPEIPFPLKDVKRVAVVGAQDSGRVAVEYLLGQGPRQGLSVASLDTVERIYWVGQEANIRSDFESCNRSRYHGLGRFFPRTFDDFREARILPCPGRGLSVLPGDNPVLRWEDPDVGERTERFDLIVLCTGFEDRSNTLLGDFMGCPMVDMTLDGAVVARRVQNEDIYKVGPAAGIGVTARERRNSPALAQIAENSAALFRYSDRTAALARFLSTTRKGAQVGEPAGPGS